MKIIQILKIKIKERKQGGIDSIFPISLLTIQPNSLEINKKRMIKGLWKLKSRSQTGQGAQTLRKYSVVNFLSFPFYLPYFLDWAPESSTVQSHQSTDKKNKNAYFPGPKIRKGKSKEDLVRSPKPIRAILQPRQQQAG